MNGDLLARLVALAPRGCRVAWRPLAAADPALLPPAEAALIPTAGSARRTEFATGRAVLHELLPDGAPIGRVPCGAPELPDGWVGSLAHDHVGALAIVAPSDALLAVGVDVEHLRPGSDDDELRAAVLRDDDAALHPTAAFVIKEAAYKVFSVLGGPMVGPLDVRVEVAGDEFVAHFPAADGHLAHSIGGVFVGNEECWAAVATVRR